VCVYLFVSPTCLDPMCCVPVVCYVSSIVVCCALCVVCCVLCVLCFVFCALCCVVLCVVCCLLCVVRCVLCAVCRLRRRWLVWNQ
jgi:hypothetical protein